MKTIGILLLASTLFRPLPQAAPGPNFVLILIDDLGYADIGPFGSKLNRTPNLDRMAAEGRKLACFYAAPVCTPSRASFMTGCYPRRVGLPAVLFPAGATGIAAEERTLPEILRDRGYATMCVGKWHLGDQPEFLPTRHGFDRYFGIPYSNDMGPAAEGARGLEARPPAAGRDHPPLPLLRDGKVDERVKAAGQATLVERYTEEAVKFIREKKEAPFFLYLPHTAVHWPHYPGPRFKGKSGRGEYSDWVMEVDWSVGFVLDALRELKLAERTLVLFTSDNGGTRAGVNAPLRGYKASTWEGGMREPTIAWWPGRIPSGTATGALTTSMDVLPTFAKLAGTEIPKDRTIDGKDIWPVLSGEAKSPHDAFYYYRQSNLEAVRSGPWKLVLQDQQLYNLDEDVGESKNVAAEHSDTVKRLQEFAERARADLGDGPKPGSGCRAPGRVPEPRPIIAPNGTIRPDLR